MSSGKRKRSQKREEKRVKFSVVKQSAVESQQSEQEEEKKSGSQKVKRRWMDEFTFHKQPLKKKRIFVDEAEFLPYDHLAQCSNHSINFKIVSSEQEVLLDQAPFFNPKFTHQVFHRDETVRGYKDLNIDVFLSPSTLRPYINYTYSKRAHAFDQLDDIFKRTFGQDSVISDREDFLKYLKDEAKAFKPPGVKIGEFMREMPDLRQDPISDQKTRIKPNSKAKNMVQKAFQIFKVNANGDKFQSFNRRLQSMFIFYIDGASYISVDNNWFYFLVYCENQLVAFYTAYEQRKPQNLGKSRALVGLGSAKNLYKLRISQCLVLPTFQRLGIGSVLLENMYTHYLKDKKCIEITVEDPSPDFQQLKDALDIKLIWRNKYFKCLQKLFSGKNKLRQVYINKDNFDSLILDQQEVGEIQQVLKLKKQNILRCFELIILAKLDPKDMIVHQKFAQEIKKKFYYQMNKNLLQPYLTIDKICTPLLPPAYSTDDKLLARRDLTPKNCCLGDAKILTVSSKDGKSGVSTQVCESPLSQNAEKNDSINKQLLDLTNNIHKKFTPTPYTGVFGKHGSDLLPYWNNGAKVKLPGSLEGKILKILAE